MTPFALRCLKQRLAFGAVTAIYVFGIGWFWVHFWMGIGLAAYVILVVGGSGYLEYRELKAIAEKQKRLDTLWAEYDAKCAAALARGERPDLRGEPNCGHRRANFWTVV